MCGIVGVLYFDSRQTVGLRTVGSMVDAIRHRGPDDDGFFLADGVGLGMCRLSIIDVVGGKQPLCDESGEIVVMQNGEIYNYVELRRDLIARGHKLRTESDTEVIAHLYEDHPDDFAAHLNGMFAIAIMDQRRRRLVLARDRIGKKPLFIYRDDEKIVFASEIKAMLAGGLVPIDVNPAAVHDFLSFNFVPLPETMFQGVRHVAPGSIVFVEGKELREAVYWRLDVDQPVEWDDERRRTLMGLLKESVELRLRADVPVGIFLSGGVDSSSIAWATVGASRKPVRAFSIGFAGTEHDETETARALAASLGLPIEIVEGSGDFVRDLDAVMWYCDQPHGDASFLPMLRLARTAKEHVKVVLTGEGADEVFGGYSWHAVGAYTTARPWEKVRETFESNAVFRHEEKDRLYADDLKPIGQRDSALLLRRVLEELPAADPITQSLMVDIAVLLPGNNLVKADRMGMAHGVELRCPFLDYRLVEFAFTIAGNAKIRDGVGKLPLREAVAGRIPDSAAWRPKRMFSVPMREWLRGPGRSLLGAIVAMPVPPLDRWFEATEIRRLVDEHAAGAVDHTRKLRALLALDIWCRRFVASVTTPD